MKKLSLLLILLIFNLGFSQELVTNGDFESGNTGWSGNGANVVLQNGNHFNEVNVTAAGNPWDVNLSYVLSLTPNVKYTLKFDAWSDRSRTIVAGIGLNHGPWDNDTTTITLSATSQTFTYNFTAPASSNADSRIIFDMGAQAGYVGIDNVSLKVYTVNPAADATLSDLKVDGATVSAFSSSTLTYTVNKPIGTTTVPQITSATTTQSGATTQITQATSIPGTATVKVTSQDGTATQTYTINYKLSGPNVAAPTPPARNATDVISLFSNAYTNIPIDAWSASWDDSSISDMQIQGNDTKKVDFTNFLGVDFSGAGHHIDASTFTNFHMDIWIDNMDLTGKVFNLKFSQWGGTAGEVSALELPLNGGSIPALVTGQWLSIDVPLTNWSNNTNKNDIAQFVITSNIPTVYFDNLYLYKGTLGVTDVTAKSKVNVYPNPVRSGENFSISEKVNKVDIYSISGEFIKSSVESTISTQGLKSGIYLLNINTKDGQKHTSKLIVK